MSVPETLLNATLVLIPIWLGTVRYLVTEHEFERESWANLTALGVFIILIGILYSLWTAVDVLTVTQPDLRNGLYALFVTLSLTGLGGAVFVLSGIEKASPTLVIGAPTITLLVVSVPWAVTRILGISVAVSADTLLTVASVLVTLLGVLVSFFQMYGDQG